MGQTRHPLSEQAICTGTVGSRQTEQTEHRAGAAEGWPATRPHPAREGRPCAPSVGLNGFYRWRRWSHPCQGEEGKAERPAGAGAVIGRVMAWLQLAGRWHGSGFSPASSSAWLPFICQGKWPAHSGCPCRAPQRRAHVTRPSVTSSGHPRDCARISRGSVPAAWPSHQHGNKAPVTRLILSGRISNG